MMESIYKFLKGAVIVLAIANVIIWAAYFILCASLI